MAGGTWAQLRRAAGELKGQPVIFACDRTPGRTSAWVGPEADHGAVLAPVKEEINSHAATCKFLPLDKTVF
jgi:hypothetical protein